MLATKVHEVFTITEKALLGLDIVLPNSNLLIVVVVMPVQYSVSIDS